MKTLLVLFSTVYVWCSVSAQNLERNGANKNEVIINTLYLFGGYAELSYERALSNKSALGISIGGMLGSPKPNYATDILTSKFALTPYYRYYFGRKPSAGFFVEGNSIIASRESYTKERNEWGFGIGIGIGAKISFENSWSAGFVLGGGSHFNQQRSDGQYGEWDIVDFPDMYPRLGIALGKRF